MVLSPEEALVKGKMYDVNLVSCLEDELDRFLVERYRGNAIRSELTETNLKILRKAYYERPMVVEEVLEKYRKFWEIGIEEELLDKFGYINYIVFDKKE